LPTRGEFTIVHGQYLYPLTPEQLAAYDIDGYIVLENLLDDTDMAPPREAMMEKVDEIANDLFKTGLITDLHLDEPFQRV
jgi:hypothetical protein